MTRTLLAHNLAQGTPLGSVHDASGGALYVAAGTTARLDRARFQGNRALALGANPASGGAVASFGAFSDTGSTFTGNQALVRGSGQALGGGLSLASDSGLLRSLIARNAALAQANGQGFGGGIAFSRNPRAVLQQVIVRGNRATTAGPDLFGDHRDV